ncbi:ABC transporter permease [Clostridium sp. Marseille-P2415]|uniref:ABC transporter permease n=1 Tax=Clostridium sp. Marseille-P2415 TaxID=1805471 RepID=UPI0009888BDF|nr:ABC transporter permease [Clostridium sp. Marseille-P2415]
MKELLIEFQKIRGRKIWLAAAALLGAQCLWGLWAFRNMDAHELSQGWERCLYHFPVLNAVMMPVIIAVIASRLCDVEHKGHTFKLLHTVMPAGKLFDAKFICGALHMIAVGFFQVIVIIIFGNVKGFGEVLPVDKLFYHLLFTTAINLTLLVLQQVLSLLFANQMLPFTVGLIGSFAGLFSMFFPKGIQKCLLWGYYGILIQVGMNWDRDTRVTDFYSVPIDWTGFMLLGIMFAVIYIAGRMLFVRKEM